MTKKEKEIIQLLAKKVINIQHQLDILVENLIIPIDEDKLKVYNDKIVDIDKSTYDKMCKMMKTNEIPFMGIA
tara:strand:+ start:662 stop:880 length:219 start_codon:yes stop_codon:yes gene_type:complete